MCSVWVAWTPYTTPFMCRGLCSAYSWSRHEARKPTSQILQQLHVQSCMHMTLLLVYLSLSLGGGSNNQTKGRGSAMESVLGCLSVCFRKEAENEPRRCFIHQVMQLFSPDNSHANVLHTWAGVAPLVHDERAPGHHRKDLCTLPQRLYRK